jgi:type I restriction enzyme S subunit
MSRYKRYERYKDSGVEWIGEIPEHWNNKKISWIFNIIGSGTTPSTSNLEYYDGDVPWVNTGDLNDGYLYETSKMITDLALKDYSTLKFYPIDTLLIAMYGATIGKLSITKIIATTNQACCALAQPKNVNIKFIFYWFLANRNHIIAMAYGGGQPNISQNLIKSLRINLPEKHEQNAIVNFLDQKTAVIDGLIADKEKLIELLQEKRQAIITEAVTKGLNPNVRLKDSGIEWIGEIPEHWGVSKIKFTTYVKGRIGWQGLRADEFIDEGPYLVTGTDFVDGLVNWDSCYHISMERYNEAPPIQLRENDLLITKDGTIGKVAIVKNKPKYAILNSGIFVTRPKNSAYLTEFMYWILNSQVFNKFIQYMSLGSTIVHLYQQTFENFSFPITNLNEQKTIAHFLDRKVAEIDGLISDIKLQIQKLKEYRQSLISEAVTGKIDVREFGSISEVI